VIKGNLITCRICNTPLDHTFANLGMQPICETYLTNEEINMKENYYPLHVFFCTKCLLVQLKNSVHPEVIFKNYAYFSSHSKGWLNHVESYADQIIKNLKLNSSSKVIEVGSNDGYLLQFFSNRNIPVLGVEPATNVASAAISKGIPTLVDFFNEKISKKIEFKHGKADLIIGNNILAQVPDLKGFVKGLKKLLHPTGTITLEFHHLLNLINRNQFDTISHERFSYLSFFIVEKLFSSHDLKIYDVEEFSTHGGSLRIYVCHANDKSKQVSSRVPKIKEKEASSGLTKAKTYFSFEERVRETKRKILTLLIKIRQKKKLISGYGAHAEAHTLLNYCGITTDFFEFTVDRNPDKQGKFVAGVHIPIFHPDMISKVKPEYIVILPWNIKEEIMKQMEHIKTWNGKFIVLIPEPKFYNSERIEINLESIE
jgi:SAM-dependent methyltransferase